MPTDVSSIDVFLAAVTEEDLPHRAARWRTSCATPGSASNTRSGTQAVGKQLKLADARERAVAVVIGPDDRDAGRGDR